MLKIALVDEQKYQVVFASFCIKIKMSHWGVNRSIRQGKLTLYEVYNYNISCKALVEKTNPGGCMKW